MAINWQQNCTLTIAKCGTRYNNHLQLFTDMCLYYQAIVCCTWRGRKH